LICRGRWICIICDGNYFQRKIYHSFAQSVVQIRTSKICRTDVNSCKLSVVVQANNGFSTD
jgi:hypothetical protein